MNQNNRNNNRRRGRGSNRGGQGGGNQGNRIDSRARGNAPQMLEKYKKLAHDASLNGDRVQTEYYLQFADHYFRVVADSRAQREDQRPRRDNEREHAFEGDEDYGDERGESQRNEQPHGRRDRYEDEREPADEGPRALEGDEGDDGTPDNPFVRDEREPQDRSRQRSGQRPRGRSRAANDAAEADDGDGAKEAGFDPGILPPSIARDEGSAPRPAARGRGRRARPADDGDEETLEALS